MQWERNDAPWDRRRWRWRFALLPKEVGEQIIWLRRFQQKGWFFDTLLARRLGPGEPEYEYVEYD